MYRKGERERVTVCVPEGREGESDSVCTGSEVGRE